MMSEADIHAVAEKKKAELGITDKAKSGQLTGMIMKELAGKADGGDVKKSLIVCSRNKIRKSPKHRKNILVL